MKWAGLIMVSCMCASCNLWDSPGPPVCDPLSPKPHLKLISTHDATSCLDPDGELVVEAIGGVAPYQFTIDDEQFFRAGQFSKLFAGDYKVKVVDAKGCHGYVNVQVGAAGNVFSATAVVTSDNACFSDNGSITVVVKNGMKPYSYQIEPEGARNDSVFSHLSDGYYRITITDAQQCKTFLGTAVPHGFTGVSYLKNVSPIISSKCNSAGCHNGDTGTTLNFVVFANVRWYGNRIKSMANLRRPHYRLTPLLDQEIQYINCWVEDGSRQN